MKLICPISKFLNDNPDAVVLYFDSDQAVTSEMFKERGIDPKRVAVFPVSTIEEFRHQAITIVDKYLVRCVENGEPFDQSIIDSDRSQ